MTVAPAGHPCQRTNDGDARTLTIVTGVYIMNAWFGGVSFTFLLTSWSSGMSSLPG